MKQEGALNAGELLRGTSWAPRSVYQLIVNLVVEDNNMALPWVLGRLMHAHRPWCGPDTPSSHCTPSWLIGNCWVWTSCVSINFPFSKLCLSTWAMYLAMWLKHLWTPQRKLQILRLCWPFVLLRHLSLNLSPVSTVHSLLQWQLVWLLCLDGSKMHPHCCPYCPLNNETIYDHYISTLTMVSKQLHFLELQYHWKMGIFS